MDTMINDTSNSNDDKLGLSSGSFIEHVRC